MMVRVLPVSRSGYYAWRVHRGITTATQQARQIRDDAVQKAFEQSHGRDGARRIERELANNGCACDLKTVRTSMKRQNLVAKAARKFKVTTDSHHRYPVSPNMLQQDFTASHVNEKWVGDITYLRTQEGWLYLAVFIDLYSRAVVGWSMSKRINRQLVCDALTMAVFRRKRPRGVIVHTDRGSQYASNDYRQLLKKHHLQQSMSGKGCCYDNACAESFFHSLKVEAVHGEPLVTRQELKQQMFRYIEIDYNKTRKHSYLDYLSPEQFERQGLS